MQSFYLYFISYSFQLLEYLRLWETVTAGDCCPVPVPAMHFKVLRGHASKTEQSVETVYNNFWRKSAPAGNSCCISFKCWKGEWRKNSYQNL